ncbi:hypothetical protein NPIL_103381, partial [Nephila pilipes]
CNLAKGWLVLLPRRQLGRAVPPFLPKEEPQSILPFLTYSMSSCVDSDEISFGGTIRGSRFKANEDEVVQNSGGGGHSSSLLKKVACFTNGLVYI